MAFAGGLRRPIKPVAGTQQPVVRSRPRTVPQPQSVSVSLHDDVHGVNQQLTERLVRSERARQALESRVAELNHTLETKVTGLERAVAARAQRVTHHVTSIQQLVLRWVAATGEAAGATSAGVTSGGGNEKSSEVSERLSLQILEHLHAVQALVLPPSGIAIEVTVTSQPSESDESWATKMLVTPARAGARTRVRSPSPQRAAVASTPAQQHSKRRPASATSGGVSFQSPVSVRAKSPAAPARSVSPSRRAVSPPKPARTIAEAVSATDRLHAQLTESARSRHNQTNRVMSPPPPALRSVAAWNQSTAATVDVAPAATEFIKSPLKSAVKKKKTRTKSKSKSPAAARKAKAAAAASASADEPKSVDAWMTEIRAISPTLLRHLMQYAHDKQTNPSPSTDAVQATQPAAAALVPAADRILMPPAAANGNAAPVPYAPATSVADAHAHGVHRTHHTHHTHHTQPHAAHHHSQPHQHSSHAEAANPIPGQPNGAAGHHHHSEHQSSHQHHHHHSHAPHQSHQPHEHSGGHHHPHHPHVHERQTPPALVSAPKPIHAVPPPPVVAAPVPAPAAAPVADASVSKELTAANALTSYLDNLYVAPTPTPPPSQPAAPSAAGAPFGTFASISRSQPIDRPSASRSRSNSISKLPQPQQTATTTQTQTQIQPQSTTEATGQHDTKHVHSGSLPAAAAVAARQPATAAAVVQPVPTYPPQQPPRHSTTSSGASAAEQSSSALPLVADGAASIGVSGPLTPDQSTYDAGVQRLRSNREHLQQLDSEILSLQAKLQQLL